MSKATEKCPAWIIDAAREGPPDIAYADYVPGELTDNQVLVKVEYSSVNYKDALAITGAGKVIRADAPVVPGVDLAGSVVESKSKVFKEGDEVIATGWELGERLNGGYCQYCRLTDWMLIKRPANLSAKTAMKVGTAGLTAALAIGVLQENGCLKKDQEETRLMITSAGGGLGSIAVCLLSGLGYHPYAISRPQNREYIESLGAKKIFDRDEFIKDVRPLGKDSWDGAIDSAGGKLLEAILPRMRYGGTVASCGLTGGAAFSATVMPFILRAVRMIGIDSVQANSSKREQAWQLISDMSDRIDNINAVEVNLPDIVDAARKLIQAQIQGRITVKVGG